MKLPKRAITLVLPYYDNPAMLAAQQAAWECWPDAVKRQVEVIVVDDASPGTPATIRETGVQTSLYRIEVDVAWNWLQARNIGAHHARGEWLILTDIDHMVPLETVTQLLAGIQQRRWASEEEFYTFARADAPDLRPYKPHLDSFFMARRFFWDVGGYDEDYAGHYGTASRWRKRCLAKGRMVHLPELRLIRYPREVVADASTVTLARKEVRDPQALRRIDRWKAKNCHGQVTLFRQPYRLVDTLC